MGVVPVSSIPQTGIVRRLLGRRFGFITPDSDPDVDVFVHINDFSPDDRDHIAVGKRIEYVLGERDGKPQAIQARLI